MTPDEFLSAYDSAAETRNVHCSMRHGPIRQPLERKTQYGFEHENDRLLPNDGFPRITSEGAEILCEGLTGDFSHWRWGIGNHPLEMPLEHLNNCCIRSTIEGDHFLAVVWTGLHYPLTTKSSSVAPSFSFDRVDMHDVFSPRMNITLCQKGDFWPRVSLLLDDNGVCAT